MIVPVLLIIVLMISAIAILFLVPSREVTVPPGKLQTLWEVLLPGTSPTWNVFGGLALVAWCYFVIQDLLILRVGTPYIILAVAFPNLHSPYGVPTPSDNRELLRLLLRPSWIWVYLAPAVLFVVNLFLVLRARRRA